MAFNLRESEALWKRRHTHRNLRVKFWARRESYRYKKWQFYSISKPDGDPLRSKWWHLYMEADERVDEWLGLRDEASYWLRKRRGQISDAKPKRGSASEHFDISEFDTHDGTPVPPSSYIGLRRLCRDVLEPMRARFGPCEIISGHRHDVYNAGIGGASRSYHIYDLRKIEVAADVKFATGTPAQWAAFARSLGRGGVGEYSQFTHCDNGPVRRWNGR